MRIWLICSKKFFSELAPIKEKLEKAGHEVTLPDCHDDPDTEERTKLMGPTHHSDFKKAMLELSDNMAKKVDAGLVVNLDKETEYGILPTYIGGGTLLEMYILHSLKKPIYLLNELDSNSILKVILHDEINAFSSIVIDGDLSKIPN